MSVDNLTIRAAFEAFMNAITTGPNWWFSQTPAPGGNPAWVWADRVLTMPVDSTIIRVTLLPTSKSQATMGTNPSKRALGLFVADVFVPLGADAYALSPLTGLQMTPMEIADTAGAVIETALLSNPIPGMMITDATAGEGRMIDGMWQVQVRAKWRLYG